MHKVDEGIASRYLRQCVLPPHDQHAPRNCPLPVHPGQLRLHLNLLNVRYSLSPCINRFLERLFDVECHRAIVLNLLPMAVVDGQSPPI